MSTLRGGEPRYRQVSSNPATVIHGEAAVVTPQDSRLHILNEVGTRVWELCDGDGASVSEIVAALMEEYEIDATVARAEVEAFLVRGVAVGLIAVA